MPKAKYEQIYRSLKRKIENNDYAFGSLLPSESTLIEAYDCSRNTVRRALAALTDEGYVQPIHGKGVRVIYQRQERTAFTVGGIETFRETVERNRLSASTKVIFFRCCEGGDRRAQRISGRRTGILSPAGALSKWKAADSGYQHIPRIDGAKPDGGDRGDVDLRVY